MVRRGQQRERRRRLGHSVALQEVAAEYVHRATKHVRGDRRGAVDDGVQLVVVALGRVRHHHQTGLDHRRHERRPRDAPLRQGRHDIRRREVLVDQHRAALADRADRRDSGSCVIHRRHDEDVFVGEHRDAGHLLNQIRLHGPVREDGALRATRRAARVHLIEIVVVAPPPIRVRRRLRADPLLVVDPAVRARAVERHPRLHVSEIGAHRVDLLDEFAAGDDEARARIAHDVRELGRREPIVQRNRRRARLGAGVVEERILETVLGEQREAVARGEAGRGQSVGELVRLCVSFTVREPAVAGFDAERVRLLAREEIERIVELHGDPPRPTIVPRFDARLGKSAPLLGRTVRLGGAPSRPRGAGHPR